MPRAASTPYSESQPVSGFAGAVSNSSQPAASAVSWGAILAGAAAAAALSLILLILGTGLGLSTVSPWSHEGVDAKTIGVGTIIWITLTQLMASGMGGYLAGRLRTRWAAVHRDEVHFRDTAHGFLAWAIATLATAALLSSVIGSIVSGGVKAGATLAGGVASAAGTAAGAAAGSSEMFKTDSDGGSLGYVVNSLLRQGRQAAAGAPGASAPPRSEGQSAVDPSTVAEITHIFTNAVRTGTLPPDDVRFVAHEIAQRTGLTQAEAERRVTESFARVQAGLKEAETAAKDAAEKARKAAAYAALWLSVSLLVGAFGASYAATYGGRQRDA